MNKSLYEFNNDKKNSIQSDLVSVILGFSDFLLDTFKHSHKYQNITNSM